MANYLKQYSGKGTIPQTEPLTADQVKNEAGGFVWAVGDWEILDRFLVLGTEGGTYYVGESKLTRATAQTIEKLIREDGLRVVQRAVEMSVSNRIPKNDTALFVLALAAEVGDQTTRTAVYDVLPQVARIGTHLFQYIDLAESTGWGYGKKRAVSAWYNSKDAEKLAYQLVKYRNRHGWTHQDVIRKAHVTPATPEHSQLLRWAVRGLSESELAVAPSTIYGFEQMQKADSWQRVVDLIDKYNLPHETVPTDYKSDPNVQWALLQNMPMTAMIRNLGNLSKSSLLVDFSMAAKLVCSRLEDGEALRKSRVHPIQVLAALITYQSGQGQRGKGTWTPVGAVVDALNGAFYASFGNVEPTGKRIVMGLDNSGSMGFSTVSGVAGLSPAMAAGAMAMVNAQVEKDVVFVAFTTIAENIVITPKMQLSEVAKKLSTAGRGTDCAVPMKWASKTGIEADAFVLMTDSQSWAGPAHAAQELVAYRRKTGLQSKLVTCLMAMNSYTLNDPSDVNGSLNVVGFDTATPQLISQFIAS